MEEKTLTFTTRIAYDVWVKKTQGKVVILSLSEPNYMFSEDMYNKSAMPPIVTVKYFELSLPDC